MGELIPDTRGRAQCGSKSAGNPVSSPFSARHPGGGMKTIFVMIKCDLGKAYEVADEAVQGIAEVSEVYSTSGQYDLLMKCHLADDIDIGHFVTEQVQGLAGIKDTFTIIGFKAFSSDATQG
jgi:DNA-binding Lrp family transcriptional regulator